MLQLLDFHHEMISNLYPVDNRSELAAEDGLLVLAKGLGMERILAYITALHADSHNLCLILNTSQEEFLSLKMNLKEPEASKLTCINNETPAKQRATMYLSGGVMVLLF